MPPSHVPALLKVPLCSCSLRPMLSATGGPPVLRRCLPMPAPSAAFSEETSQELSAGGAAPGHRQGDKAQLAVEAQLLPVSGTNLAKHSPRSWKGGEGSGPWHWEPSAGAGGQWLGPPATGGSASPLPFGTGCLRDALRHRSTCPQGKGRARCLGAGARLQQRGDGEPQ